MKSEYKLRYLPLFYEDLEEIMDYISNELLNPEAAAALLDHIETAILKRQEFAESFATYNSSHDRKNPYYRINVNNFSIFYVVLCEGNDKFMEVRRILYNRQNWTEIL